MFQAQHSTQVALEQNDDPFGDPHARLASRPEQHARQHRRASQPINHALRRIGTWLLQFDNAALTSPLQSLEQDALTGLPNRIVFLEQISARLVPAQAEEVRPFALLFLDLDRFKIVNDSFGHVVGDRLLLEVARRLRACLSAEHTIARLGGDEFGILLEGVYGIDEAAQLANVLLQHLARPFTFSGIEVFTTGSIGIVTQPAQYEQPQDLLRDADIAMYLAKELGKARYVVFETDMHTRVVTRMQIEAELRVAIDREVFTLYYQPIVASTAQTISGVEALVRWQHPRRGLIAPSEFIGVAEETGLIVPLGAWVLQTACAQIAAWRDAGLPPIYVAVNISARQFRARGLCATVERIIEEYEIEPEYLRLELTEGSIMEDVEGSIGVLRQLRALGVQLAIDDFGVGYSSLSYLQRLPVATVKIDRSFVRDVTTNPNDAAIAAAITAIAHRLNLTVIAEGVETAEQLDFLRAHDCDAIQGYLFSRPLPAAALSTLLAQGRRFATAIPSFS